MAQHAWLLRPVRLVWLQAYISVMLYCTSIMTSALLDALAAVAPPYVEAVPKLHVPS